MAIHANSVRALHDDVLVVDMIFDSRVTSAGIILLNDDMRTQGIHPRWAKVYAVGPDQQDAEVGKYVLVAHGRWSRGCEVITPEGKITLRRVDPNDILVMADEPITDECMSTAVHAEKY